MYDLGELHGDTVKIDKGGEVLNFGGLYHEHFVSFSMWLNINFLIITQENNIFAHSGVVSSFKNL